MLVGFVVGSRIDTFLCRAEIQANPQIPSVDPICRFEGFCAVAKADTAAGRHGAKPAAARGANEQQGEFRTMVAIRAEVLTDKHSRKQEPFEAGWMAAANVKIEKVDDDDDDDAGRMAAAKVKIEKLDDDDDDDDWETMDEDEEQDIAVVEVADAEAETEENDDDDEWETEEEEEDEVVQNGDVVKAAEGEAEEEPKEEVKEEAKPKAKPEGEIEEEDHFIGDDDDDDEWDTEDEDGVQNGDVIEMGEEAVVEEEVEEEEDDYDDVDWEDFHGWDTEDEDVIID